MYLPGPKKRANALQHLSEDIIGKPLSPLNLNLIPPLDICTGKRQNTFQQGVDIFRKLFFERSDDPIL